MEKRMKIALVTTDNREAHRQYTLGAPYFGTAPAALLEGLAEYPQAEIHVVTCTQKQMSSPTKLANNVWFHSMHIPKWGWLRSGYLGCIRAVGRKLEEIRPDLVHAQGTERDCAVAAVFATIPKLLTIHGNCRAIAQLRRSPPFSYWWLQAQLERLCLPRFDGVICISKYTQGLVSRLARKTWLLPNAVDSSFFKISRQESGPVPILLVVANVESRKNQIGLIRSLGSLAEQRPFQLRFFGNCGEDDYGRKFRQLAATKPWCFYGGMLDRTSLRQEFARASAVILPTWEDNCPMVLLEAQAAGIPIIASNVGGIPDLVEDDITGILTNPSDPQTMPKALTRLWDSPELASRLIQKGREQAQARFHPKVIAQKHLDIYREVIAA